MSERGNLHLASGEVFTVPEGVRHLTGEELARLERAFADWRERASVPAWIPSRRRMHLIFQLLRHTGARLGEILALDETRDIDVEAGVVRLGKGRSRRDVPVPDKLARELKLLLRDPEVVGGAEGGWFRVDQGYLRKIFYARARECGLPAELANPRVLRNSRAVEMLRSNVPLAVVRRILGQSSSDLTEVFQHYSQAAANSLVRRLALSELPGRTSARNTFLGRVVRVRGDGVMAEVLMETEVGDNLYAVITGESVDNLGLEPGAPVAATIKAPLVNVFRAGASPGSTRNSFAAAITSVRSTSVLTEIAGRTESGHKLCALISSDAAADLGLAVGDAAEFRFKALSVVINTV